MGRLDGGVRRSLCEGRIGVMIWEGTSAEVSG